jgi:hypothetical protein
MAKPPPHTSSSTSASDLPLPLPTTTTTGGLGLLGSLTTSAYSLLAAARRSPVTTLVAAFFLLALFMYGEDVRTIAELSIDDYLYPDADFYNVSGLPPLALPPPACDLSRGRWVFDNVSLPAYREKDCTFLTKQVTCLANGRPDHLWQYWKWQPDDCFLPTYVSSLHSSPDLRHYLTSLRARLRASLLPSNPIDSTECVQSIRAGSTLGGSWRRCAGSD